MSLTGDRRLVNASWRLLTGDRWFVAAGWRLVSGDCWLATPRLLLARTKMATDTYACGQKLLHADMATDRLC